MIATFLWNNPQFFKINFATVVQYRQLQKSCLSCLVCRRSLVSTAMQRIFIRCFTKFVKKIMRKRNCYSESSRNNIRACAWILVLALYVWMSSQYKTTYIPWKHVFNSFQSSPTREIIQQFIDITFHVKTDFARRCVFIVYIIIQIHSITLYLYLI